MKENGGRNMGWGGRQSVPHRRETQNLVCAWSEREQRRGGATCLTKVRDRPAEANATPLKAAPTSADFIVIASVVRLQNPHKTHKPHRTHTPHPDTTTTTNPPKNRVCERISRAAASVRRARSSTRFGLSMNRSWPSRALGQRHGASVSGRGACGIRAVTVTRVVGRVCKF
jgi:hypothetical protein